MKYHIVLPFFDKASLNAFQCVKPTWMQKVQHECVLNFFYFRFYLYHARPHVFDPLYSVQVLQ